MSYDYEKYDGKRYVVDGEIIGVLAMECGHEVEAVFDEYHAEVALTPEQERQAEAYHENLRTTLCAQYKKVDGLQAENAKLQELILDIADMLGKNTNLLRELCEENANLLAENARLRKLLLDVWNDAIEFDGFLDYVMDEGELYNKDELPHYQEHMRELGIEVSEWPRLTS